MWPSFAGDCELVDLELETLQFKAFLIIMVPFPESYPYLFRNIPSRYYTVKHICCIQCSKLYCFRGLWKRESNVLLTSPNKASTPHKYVFSLKPFWRGRQNFCISPLTSLSKSNMMPISKLILTCNIMQLCVNGFMKGCKPERQHLFGVILLRFSFCA